MSYEEKGDSVILTMSREDYDRLWIALWYYTGGIELRAGNGPALTEMIELLNRLNSWNLNYTPHQAGEKS
jgi:hypothetical protein